MHGLLNKLHLNGEIYFHKPLIFILWSILLSPQIFFTCILQEVKSRNFYLKFQCLMFTRSSKSHRRIYHLSSTKLHKNWVGLQPFLEPSKYQCHLVHRHLSFLANMKVWLFSSSKHLLVINISPSPWGPLALESQESVPYILI